MKSKVCLKNCFEKNHQASTFHPAKVPDHDYFEMLSKQIASASDYL
jgi:hypothetical protein